MLLNNKLNCFIIFSNKHNILQEMPSIFLSRMIHPFSYKRLDVLPNGNIRKYLLIWLLVNILFGIKIMVTKQFIKLTIYMSLCVLPGQFSCQSDEIKFHDNILVVLAQPENEVLIRGALAKLVVRGYAVTVS